MQSQLRSCRCISHGVPSHSRKNSWEYNRIVVTFMPSLLIGSWFVDSMSKAQKPLSAHTLQVIYQLLQLCPRLIVELIFRLTKCRNHNRRQLRRKLLDCLVLPFVCSPRLARIPQCTCTFTTYTFAQSSSTLARSPRSLPAMAGRHFLRAQAVPRRPAPHPDV